MKKFLKKQRGASLLELMVALAIGVILLLALSSVYITANQSSKTRSVEEALDEAARQIFEHLQQDLNMAGFVDVFDRNADGAFANKIAAIKENDRVGANLGRLTEKTIGGAVYEPKSPFEMIYVGLKAVEGKVNNNLTNQAITLRFQNRQLERNTNTKSRLGMDVARDCNGQEVQVDYVENIYQLDVANREFECDGNGGQNPQRVDPQPLVSNVADLQFRYFMTNPVNTKDTLTMNATVYDSQSGLYIHGNKKTAAEVEQAPLSWSAVTAVEVCVVVGAEPLTSRGNQTVRELQPRVPLCEGQAVDRNDDDRNLYREYVRILSIPNALYFTPERGS